MTKYMIVKIEIKHYIIYNVLDIWIHVIGEVFFYRLCFNFYAIYFEPNLNLKCFWITLPESPKANGLSQKEYK